MVENDEICQNGDSCDENNVNIFHPLISRKGEDTAAIFSKSCFVMRKILLLSIGMDFGSTLWSPQAFVLVASGRAVFLSCQEEILPLGGCSSSRAGESCAAAAAAACG